MVTILVPRGGSTHEKESFIQSHHESELMPYSLQECQYWHNTHKMQKTYDII